MYTNVLRSSNEYDANVSAGLFNFNNKKNTYRFNGKFAVSQIINPSSKNSIGYAHDLRFAKTGGRWNFNLSQSVEDDQYNINDLGLIRSNNKLNHNLNTGYRWIKPKKWYNRIQVNFNAVYSMLYKKFLDQKINTNFTFLNTNVNANAQLKNLWHVGMFMGYVPKGNDFFEPRQTGYSFRTSQRVQFNGWFQTNEAKKYVVSLNYFIGIKSFSIAPLRTLIFHTGTGLMINSL